MNITFAPTAKSSITLTPIRDGLWRVAGIQGTILGHVERIPDSHGDRYLARRLRHTAGAVPSGTTTLGSFWRLEDAVDCFRFS